MDPEQPELPEAGANPAASEEEDSDDDSASEIGPEQLEALQSLEAELAASPNLYDKHLQYIKLLRTLKLRVRLKEAHERMASLFPLTAALWLEWIGDELEQVSNPEDFEFIKNLFARGAQDYLSVDLWAQYLAFVSELDPEVQALTADGQITMRALCEQAVAAAGLHIPEGARIWDAYRQYELAVLAANQGGEKQTERVRSLYQRQVQIPLSGNQDVLTEYQAWEASQPGTKGVPPHVASAAVKAQDALSLRAIYEESVGPNKQKDAALLAAYNSYIKLEQAQGERARMQLLYERAIADFPLTVDLWQAFLAFCEHTLHIPAITSAVATRARRNCYWSGALWAAAIRAEDGAGAEREHLAQLTSSALSAGVQGPEEYMEVLLASLDAVRRRVPPSSAPLLARLASQAEEEEAPAASGLLPQASALRTAFVEATAVMSTYFTDFMDRSLRLPAYWAHCEVHLLGDLAAARSVWEDVVKTGLGKYADVWCAWAAQERALRQVQHARAVYRRAHSRKLEQSGQYHVCSEWLRFEREEGSVEDYITAQAKAGPVMQEVAAARAAAELAAVPKVAKKATVLNRDEMVKMRQQADPNFKNAPLAKKGKRALGEGEEQGSKRMRTREPEPANAQGAGEDVDMEGQEDAAGADEDMAADSERKQRVARGEDDEHVVFVRGLPHGTTESQLQLRFKECGPLSSVRIPLHPNGQRRNFAYVQFENNEALQRAIGLDGCTLPGSDAPLMVAKSAPPGGGGGKGGGRGRFDNGRGRFDGGRGRFDAGRGRSGGRGGRGGRGGERHSDEGQHSAGGFRGGRGGQGRAPQAGLGHTGRQARSLQQPGGGPAGGGAAEGNQPPKSNSDFRAMLLASKK